MNKFIKNILVLTLTMSLIILTGCFGSNDITNKPDGDIGDDPVIEDDSPNDPDDQVPGDGDQEPEDEDPDNEVEDEEVDGSNDYITTDDERIISRIYVNSVSTLEDAIDNAVKGTAVIIEDGTYNKVNLSSDNDGSVQNPIFIMAKNPGLVKITGESQLTINGDYNIISGLLFTEGDPTDDKGAFDVKGSYNRITNNKVFEFEDSSCTGQSCDKWISVSGVENEIDRNHLEGKTTSGALLTVWRTPGKEDRHHIHNNYFKDYGNASGETNGLEGIRIGTSNDSQSDSKSIVENNVFENMDGEIELISIKSGSNIVRGNVIINSASLITSRHGKNNTIENNIFLGQGKSGSGGIRMYDSGHIVRNNYIENVSPSGNSRGGIVIHSGINVPGEETTLNKQWTANNILVENNTIIDSDQSFLFDDKYEYGPQNIEIKNNFVYSTKDELFRYDIDGLDETYESTIEFSNNSFYGSDLNKGNGNLDRYNISLKSSTPTTTEDNGFKYYSGSQGAKDLKMINSTDVGNNW